jgi:hypothetical protein
MERAIARSALSILLIPPPGMPGTPFSMASSLTMSSAMPASRMTSRSPQPTASLHNARLRRESLLSYTFLASSFRAFGPMRALTSKTSPKVYGAASSPGPCFSHAAGLPLRVV